MSKSNSLSPSLSRSRRRLRIVPDRLHGEGSMNGAAGQMPAFYDGELFTVNMKELPKCLRLANREEQEYQRDLCFERSGRGTGFHSRDRCHPG